MKRAGITSLMVLVLVGVVASGPQSRAAEGPKVIPIVAKRFGFTPDHVTLKKGENVVLRLTSQDVTHGFFVRPLKVDELIPAGKTLDVNVQPKQAGTFNVICHHFCGVGHGNMKMTITVEP